MFQRQTHKLESCRTIKHSGFVSLPHKGPAASIKGFSWFTVYDLCENFSERMPHITCCLHTLRTWIWIYSSSSEGATHSRCLPIIADDLNIYFWVLGACGLSLCSGGSTCAVWVKLRRHVLRHGAATCSSASHSTGCECELFTYAKSSSQRQRESVSICHGETNLHPVAHTQALKITTLSSRSFVLSSRQIPSCVKNGFHCKPVGLWGFLKTYLCALSGSTNWGQARR